jgi:PAS domain S-box-containing protein
MGCRGSEVRILSPRPIFPGRPPTRGRRLVRGPQATLSESRTPKEAAASLWQEQPFRRLVDGVSDYAILLLDTEGRIVSWNRGAELINGYIAAEVVGRHFSIFYPSAAIAKRWPEHELETAKRLGSFEDEGWRLRKDGTRFWASVVISAVRDEQGRLLGFSKITRDLSERRRVEERLRLSEERFRLLVEGVEDYGIFLMDERGYIASWNVGAQRINGYSADEAIGKHFSIFYPPEALARKWPAHELEEATRTGRYEEEGWRVRKDGSHFWASVVITALRDIEGGLRGFSKITRDLSERREYEERLRQSEERFRLLLEGVQDYAICMLDPDGRLTSWNSGGQRMTGFAPADIVGQGFERFYAPEDVEAGRPAGDLRRALLQRRSEEIAWRLRRDGSRFWAQTILTPLHDDEGRLRGFALVMRDLSEKKRMQSLEEQGRHLTEFLAMLAHELRNPLAPIRNALNIMALNKDTPPQVAWSREIIERQTTQLTRLVDDLLDVSRITRGEMRLRGETVDLNTAAQRAIETTRPLIDARRQALHVALSPHALSIHGDMVRITQVIVNLLNNAAKYTPEGGAIWLQVDAAGADARIRVRDNGVGIPAHLIDHVFELFAQGERSIDRAEGGLGIGLTLARRIVKLHGGGIAAASDGPGKGAEFTVTLPLPARSG